jgi:hypothetical protein
MRVRRLSAVGHHLRGLVVLYSYSQMVQELLVAMRCAGRMLREIGFVLENGKFIKLAPGA